MSPTERAPLPLTQSCRRIDAELPGALTAEFPPTLAESLAIVGSPPDDMPVDECDA